MFLDPEAEDNCDSLQSTNDSQYINIQQFVFIRLSSVQDGQRDLLESVRQEGGTSTERYSAASAETLHCKIMNDSQFLRKKDTKN
jgi:hypothetical protein